MGKKTWGSPGTANVAFLESGGVISTSSALRLPLAVSGRPGEDTGVCSGALSGAATSGTVGQVGIKVGTAFDDEEDAIGMGEGLALALRELLRGFLSRTRGACCCIGTSLPKIVDTLGSWSYKLEATGS
jgi:hypothetical protein